MLSCKRCRADSCSGCCVVDLTGKFRVECRVLPQMLKLAIPVVPVRMHDWPSICAMALIMYDFPVPAEPQTIIRSGCGGCLFCFIWRWCCVMTEYANCCFPLRVVTSTGGSWRCQGEFGSSVLAVRDLRIHDGHSWTMLGGSDLAKAA